MGSQDKDAEEILWNMHIWSRRLVLPAVGIALGLGGLGCAETYVPDFDIRGFTPTHFFMMSGLAASLAAFLWWFSKETYASQQAVQDRIMDEYFGEGDSH